MKLNGKILHGNTVSPLVLQLGDEVIKLKIRTLRSEDWKELDRLLPKPELEKAKVAASASKNSREELEQRLAEKNRLPMEEYFKKSDAFQILKSLDVSEELEFETVKMDDPNTWLNYEKEMEDAGFTPAMVMQMRTKIYEVNTFNSQMLEDARKSFLAELRAQAKE